MPNSVLSRRRSWIARFAVLAVLASMLVIPGVASAQVTIIDTSSSCPASTPSAGFTDLAGLDQTTVRAIDCLVSFGISRGTSTTTFSPSNPVTRWQMALFLTRQATVHNVPLGDGSDQGFTDIAALDAETQRAINQLKQLGVTQGTSATTYSPNDNVTRWQMALFLKRLAAGAGVALNATPPSAGFGDISGLIADAQLAINQLAAAGVAAGTSATTFSPNNDVTRWQMALFLTRVLAADGITPGAAAGQVSVTPATEASLPNGAARSYSATFRNADNSLYTGRVGIQLVDADAANAPVYNTPATNVTFQTIDGAAAAGTSFGGFAGSDGVVTFTVRHAGAASDVVPVAWIDLDGDGTYESTGNNAPTEPFGLGGETDFSGAPATEAVLGTYAGMVVDSVDKAGDDFEAGEATVNCGNGAGALCMFEYDSNDGFVVEGVVTDLAGFEAALSETDVITISYNPTPANVSTFEITDNKTAASSLKVTDPASARSIDSNNYVIRGTGQVGASIRIYTDVVGPNDTLIAGETQLGSTTVAADGTWAVTVPLTQNTANNFVAWQRVQVGDTPTLVDVPTITEGAPAAAKITSSAFGAAGAAGLSNGDTITITFNEAITGVGSGDSLDIRDTDGSTATIVIGTDTTFTLNPASTVLTLTIVNPPFPSGGTTPGILGLTQITAITGFQGADGLAIDLVGSGAGRNFNVS